MGKLVLFLKDASPVEIPLARERVTIGRRPDNDVCLPFPAVSGEHAAIVTILTDSFLEDLGSTNGTLVNGRPVAKHFLRDRDQIDVGRQLLVYLADEDAKVEPPGGGVARDDRPEPAANVAPVRGTARSESTPLSAVDEDLGAALVAASAIERSAQPPSPGRRFDEPTTGEREFAESTFDADIAAMRQARVDTGLAPPAGPDDDAPAPVARVHARLRVLTGRSAGQIVPIARDDFVLGRIGTQVAAIERRGRALVIVPREGAAPPTVNGEPVPPEGLAIIPGDGLEVAGTRLELLAAD
ncbi:hypothetical protein BURK1_01818 [Burkholderiales bacterium]|nr:hypothetical protein BURK1_01818 [Burkholderiales bacterium]